MAMAAAMMFSTTAPCAPICELSSDVLAGARGAGTRVSGAAFAANGDVAVGLRAANNKAALGGLLRNPEVQALGFVNVSQQPAARGPRLVLRASAAAQVSVPDGAFLVFSDAVSSFALPSWSQNVHSVLHFVTKNMNWTDISAVSIYHTKNGLNWGSIEECFTFTELERMLLPFQSSM